MEPSELIQGGQVSAERQVGGGEQIKRVNRKAETSRDASQKSPLRFELEPIRHPAYTFSQRGSPNRNSGKVETMVTGVFHLPNQVVMATGSTHRSLILAARRCLGPPHQNSISPLLSLTHFNPSGGRCTCRVPMRTGS